MRRLGAPLILLAVVAAALALTAGAGRETGDTETPGPPVPELSIAHLDGNGDFALSELASARSPTLLWFWAPWCEICNHEAPAIERLAHDAQGELAVVAIGGRDQATNGPAFVSRHRLRSPTVLFDEPMSAWRACGIPVQPDAVLLDSAGRERGRWLGAFDTADALAAARAL